MPPQWPWKPAAPGTEDVVRFLITDKAREELTRTLQRRPDPTGAAGGEGGGSGDGGGGGAGGGGVGGGATARDAMAIRENEKMATMLMKGADFTGQTDYR